MNAADGVLGARVRVLANVLAALFERDREFSTLAVS